MTCTEPESRKSVVPENCFVVSVGLVTHLHDVNDPLLGKEQNLLVVVSSTLT